jgi:hypothetical protein
MVEHKYIDVTIEATGESIASRLGLSAPECVNLLETLESAGYIEMITFPIRNWKRVPRLEPHRISHLTDKGLREIGELPDPHYELMQRLDLAIQQIQQDPRLSEPQKRQAINWLQEGTTIARTLTIDAIKAILVGAIL